jgi:glycosyltransferase involved in cell wall biosynthesis
MRILQFASSYPVDERDATAPFVRSIARALAHRGHDIHLLVPERTGAPMQSEEKGICVTWLRYAPTSRLRVIGHAQSLQNDMQLRAAVWPALPLYLAAQWRVGARLCRQWKPDLIHSHWVLPNGPVAALLASQHKLPLVINLHGSDVFMALRSPLYRRVAQRVFSQAQAIVAPSPQLRDGAICLGADPRRVHLHPHGVDLDVFHPPDVEPSNPVILFAGRLVAKKGINVLLACAPAILSQFPTAELWIAGYGDQQDVLEKQRNALPPNIQQQVVFLGPIAWNQMPDLLRRATMFVAPSVRDNAGNQDGLPTVILEAMACARPVVASDIAGIPLVVRHGVNGLLTPPGDKEALAQSIKDLLAAPERCKSLGVASRQFIEQEFTWSAEAERLDNLFLTLRGLINKGS